MIRQCELPPPPPLSHPQFPKLFLRVLFIHFHNYWLIRVCFLKILFRTRNTRWNIYQHRPKCDDKRRSFTVNLGKGIRRFAVFLYNIRFYYLDITMFTTFPTHTHTHPHQIQCTCITLLLCESKYRLIIDNENKVKHTQHILFTVIWRRTYR